ncbi:MAG: GGDEF domain-containing protein [Clostridia bacterium]|nr:GGDEF domain-containing protein [Clostridia bacterium]
MAIKYGKKKRRQHSLLYSIVTACLLCAVFFSVVGYFYRTAENEASETLHIQTKQIKDDLTLQLKSDQENLYTMANFAAKLYSDGESYDILFASFKPIGLFSNIGILKPDNIFTTKIGSMDLTGKISFQEEAAKGAHITGRVPDLTGGRHEIIRSAVPIRVNDETVGILYGVIRPEDINARYSGMAKELDAQLFVYDKETGHLVIDTVSEEPANISFLENREYTRGNSYEKLVGEEKGYSSFRSAITGEELYLHYSMIDDTNWGIILGRYESQVFAKTHQISAMLLVSFLAIMAIVACYLLYLMANERRRSKAAIHASNIRRLLLEINQQQGNISEALRQVMNVSEARSSFFVDTDGEDYHCILPEMMHTILSKDEKRYFVAEIFRYSSDFHAIHKKTVGFLCVRPNRHLKKTNPKLYEFLKERRFKDVSFATVTDKNNHVSVLGVINSLKKRISRTILEDIAVCFSIAIYNKKHLNKTETAVVTDSLTGVSNRVAYKKDILLFDEENPADFSCVYIDVNELHMRNNKYGHAAGDEMLVYIGNTLKEVFYGQNVYRMGGDEFLVFAQGVSQNELNDLLDTFMQRLKVKDYRVAIGTSFRSKHVDCEEMVREAEIRMYEAKAAYYQTKERGSVAKNEDESYLQVKTGIVEIDTLISVLKEHYNGIYRVSLETDHAHRILMPSYFDYNEQEAHFSQLLTKYIDEGVHPDYHRPVTTFLNYDAIRRQLSEGGIPSITYKKANGELVSLRVYNLNESADHVEDTLWIFAKN